jgi:D-alanyl-D-alanine carboxypeptidase
VRRRWRATTAAPAIRGRAGERGQATPRLAPPSTLDDRAAAKPPPGIELGANAVRVRFKRPPRAALLFDLDSGRVLWSRKPLKIVPIASLTKIMTALLVAERTEPDQTARISANAVKFRGSEVGVLPRGKRVPVEPLLYGMMLPSGNDAAIALAERIGGTERRFARMMDQRAHALGLRCTHFVSSYGLQDRNESCAADLAALAREAIRQPRIAHVVRRHHVSVHFPIKGGRLDLFNTNPLLRAPKFPGTIGLKTGYTDRAGHCLVAIARRGGRTLGAVLLNSPNTGEQARRLLQAGFGARSVP